MSARVKSGPLPLTDKQLEVLACKARGWDMPQIARELQISVYTARGHLRTAMERLDAPNGTAAVMAAVQAGLLNSDGSIIREAHSVR